MQCAILCFQYWCTVYSVYNIVVNMKCAVCSAQHSFSICIQFEICMVKCVQGTVYSVQCVILRVQCTLCSVKCIVFRGHCVVCSVQCSVCSDLLSRLSPPAGKAISKETTWKACSQDELSNLYIITYFLENLIQVQLIYFFI